MKLAKNAFTHALAAGDKQVGLWISLCSNFVAEVTAPAGYDWALIDMEHSPNDYFSVLGQLQAFAASDTTAIVRVEWNDTVAVKRLLDLGAPGILFPMIQSVAEAEKAVAATRYPPHGVRGVSGATRATKFGRVTDYVARIEEETTVLLQLETRAAVEQAEAIADVDGIHGIFFGPGDIAADIGKLGKPAFWRKRRITCSRQSKVGCREVRIVPSRSRQTLRLCLGQPSRQGRQSARRGCDRPWVG